MAPVVDAQPEASLPRLLTLDQQPGEFGEKLQEAARIVGISIDSNKSRKSSSETLLHVSTSRSEFILRWILEKLKTTEGRLSCLETDLLWEFAQQLLECVPVSSTARLLQSSGFLKNLEAYLKDGADLFSSQLQQNLNTSRINGSSSPPRKRKRGEREPSPLVNVDKSLSTIKQLRNLLGITLFLDRAVALANGGPGMVDGASQGHIAAALRTTPQIAAQVLNQWLRSLKLILCGNMDHDIRKDILASHAAILYIWTSRSREQTDDSGASSIVFSSNCFVSLVELLSQLTHETKETSESILNDEILGSLETLASKHIFIPAHISFNASQSTHRSDINRARKALFEFVESLRIKVMTMLNFGERELVRAEVLVKVLPSLLDLAIRLCPSATPTQRSSSVPWIESVFITLSTCAKEPIPHQALNMTLSDVLLSPMCGMLSIMKKRGIKPTNKFLESVLVGYSGLSGLRKDGYPLRLDVVATLLDLNGGVFLLKKDDTMSGQKNYVQSDKGKHTEYVEALVGSLSEVTSAKLSTSSDASANEPSSGLKLQAAKEESLDFIVGSIFIPLMQAYSASRQLSSFISLWFWEIRRSWTAVGNRDEDHVPWFSRKLRHAFRDLLEKNLSAARICELLIEFILPIKLYGDEQKTSGLSNKNLAPSLAAFVILELLLYSIEKEETLQQNLTAWNGLRDVISQFTKPEFRGFAGASRVWSILARLHKLSFTVDGKEGFLKHQEAAFGSESFKEAIELISSVGDMSGDENAATSLEAYHYIMTLCNYEPSTLLSHFSAKAVLAVNTDAIQRLGKTLGSRATNPRTHSKIIRKLDRHFEQKSKMMTTCFVQYPSALLALTSESRQSYFAAVLLLAADSHGNVNPEYEDEPTFDSQFSALVETLVDGPKGLLDDMLHVLIDAITKPTVFENGANETINVVLYQLLSIPPGLIPRYRREFILNNLRLLYEPDNYSQIDLGELLPSTPETLALAIRIFDYPNPTSKLCIDAECIWSTARAYDTQIDDHHDYQNNSPIEILQLLDGFYEAVLKQALVDATEERRNIFDRRLCDLLVGDIKVHKHTDSGYFWTRPATTLLLRSFAPLSSMINTKIAELVEKHIVMSIETAFSYPKETSRHWTVIHSYNALAKVLSAGHDPYRLFQKYLSTPSQGSGMIDLGLVDLVGILLWSKVSTNEALPNLLAFLARCCSSQARSLILEAFERRISKSHLPEKLELVQSLLEDAQLENLQLLHVIIKSFFFDDTARIKETIDLIFKLSEISANVQDIGRFGASISCINTMIRDKPWLATQHAVDSLLAALTTVSSSDALELPPEHAGHIYLCLCQLTVSTILVHRRKLGGRMHLLIRLLQNLMTCLFIPHRYQASSSSTAHPPWLCETRLNTEHAVAFSRILTTLCSPTTSSTSMHRHNELVDETKKAKEYAGQYVSYLLLHYCTLQLHGTIAAEVREKLQTGLWAAMEIVDIEAMRGMNAGMGKDERVIWGSLYGEWQKFGRFRLT